MYRYVGDFGANRKRLFCSGNIVIGISNLPCVLGF